MFRNFIIVLSHAFFCLATSSAAERGSPVSPQANSDLTKPGLTQSRSAYVFHKRGQFQCHTFRIPAIARAMDGSLLAVYDMRYLSEKDLQGHMDIGLSRSSDGGETWTDPVPIMDMGEFGGKPKAENGCSDPNILVDPKSGEVFVSAVWTHGKPGTHQWVGKGSEPGHDIHRSTQFLMVRSRDHGKTWSKPENWTTRLKDPAWHLFAPAPGNGIAMRDGTLVIPTQGRDATGLPFSNLMFSKDHGKTWTVSNLARSWQHLDRPSRRSQCPARTGLHGVHDFAHPARWPPHPAFFESPQQISPQGDDHPGIIRSGEYMAA